MNWHDLLTSSLSVLMTGGTGGLLIKTLADHFGGKAKRVRKAMRELEAWKNAYQVLEEALHSYRLRMINAGLEPPPWPTYDRPVVDDREDK